MTSIIQNVIMRVFVTLNREDRKTGRVVHTENRDPSGRDMSRHNWYGSAWERTSEHVSDFDTSYQWHVKTRVGQFHGLMVENECGADEHRLLWRVGSKTWHVHLIPTRLRRLLKDLRDQGLVTFCYAQIGLRGINEDNYYGSF